MRDDLGEDKPGLRQRTSRMRTWIDWKEDGKRAYEERDFTRALESYRRALRPEYECPTKADKAVLWSNIVACRLQLVEKQSAGDPQARAAVEDAKQCIQLNPNWAKGYVRLASAYIALGGHSNDACNALQSAVRLDPSNSEARQMLVRELRRDHASAAASAATASAGSSGSHAPQPQPPVHEEDSNPYPPHNPDYVPPRTNSSASAASSSSPSSFFSSSAAPRPPSADQPRPANQHHHSAAVDDGLGWQERISFQIARVTDWYRSLNGDVKTMLKIGLFVLALYVAFGGRFGFESATSYASNKYHNHNPNAGSRGNYGSDSAYEQYRRQQQQRRRTHEQPSHHYEATDSSYYDTYYAPPRHSSSPSFSIASLFDGSFQSIVILGGIAYICHRNGINPFQAIMMLNLMAGGRRGMYGGGYYGGGGFGRRRGFRL